MQATHTFDCVLFDLDGTLADTAPDMVGALNAVLEAEGRQRLPVADVKDHVSHGTAALIRLGFGEQQDETAYQRRVANFLQYYQTHLSVYTRLFPGMDELLATLEQLSLRWGVVTNKPGWLTDPLMEQLGLQARSSCTVSGDSTPERKPHPLPMHTAARLADVEPHRCLYLGDAQRDIEAGNNAGMTTLIAHWGYIDDGQTPRTWGADGHLEHPLDTLDWVRTPNFGSTNKVRRRSGL
ncbi:MAG: HAD family hydrolase [bacterium]